MRGGRVGIARPPDEANAALGASNAPNAAFGQVVVARGLARRRPAPRPSAGHHAPVNVGHAVAIVVAGMWAGMINTIVGSGTLVTFPVLLALGYPPLTANVSNGLGLVPGSVAGALGYRRELAGRRGRVVRLGMVSGAGALLGAGLLLWLPASTFDAVVPVLVGLGVVLVIVQPFLARRLASRDGAARTRLTPGLLAGIFGTGVYGGYFGAAQGVLLLAVLGIGLDDELQRHNAVKNVLATVANLVSGVVFALVAPTPGPWSC